MIDVMIIRTILYNIWLQNASDRQLQWKKKNKDHKTGDQYILQFHSQRLWIGSSIILLLQ